MTTKSPSRRYDWAWIVVFLPFLLGQVVLVVVRARQGGEDAVVPVLAGTISASLLIAGLLLAAAASTHLRERALRRMFPDADVFTSRRMPTLEESLRYIEHETVPQLFSIVVRGGTVSAWRGIHAPRRLFVVPAGALHRVTERRLSDGGVRQVDAVILHVMVDGREYELPLYFVGGGIGGLLPRRGSPGEEIAVLQRAALETR